MKNRVITREEVSIVASILGFGLGLVINLAARKHNKKVIDKQMMNLITF